MNINIEYCKIKEVVKYTTFIILLFMFTLINFTLIFKEEKNTFITIGLTNLDLKIRVEV